MTCGLFPPSCTPPFGFLPSPFPPSQNGCPDACFAPAGPNTDNSTLNGLVTWANTTASQLASSLATADAAGNLKALSLTVPGATSLTFLTPGASGSFLGYSGTTLGFYTPTDVFTLMGTANEVLVNGTAGVPTSGPVTLTLAPIAQLFTYLGPTGTPSSTTFLRGDGSWHVPLASPAGSDSQLQFNSVGVLSASSFLTWSGNFLEVGLGNTANTQQTMIVKGGTGTGTSFGLQIISGTNASDYGLFIGDAAGAAQMFVVEGTGQIKMPKFYSTAGVLASDASGNITVTTGGSAAGANTQLQFNNSGVLGASSLLTWSGATLTSNGVSLGGTGAIGVNSNCALTSGTMSSIAAQGTFTTLSDGSTSYGLISNVSIVNGAHTGTIFNALYGAAPVVTGTALGGGYMLFLEAPATGMAGYANFSGVGRITLTGLNGMAVGATTPSTGAFTALSATGTTSVTTLTGTIATFTTSVAGSVNNTFSNTNAGATAYSALLVQNSTNSVSLTLTSTAFSGSQLTGGATGQSANLFTTASLPLTLGTGGMAALLLDVTQGATFTGKAVSKSPTAGVGYSTGAGSAVTQLTNKATGVTINTVSGAITMNNAALLSAAAVSFTVTNSTVAVTDVPQVAVATGQTGGPYESWISAVGAGSFQITIRNNSGGTLSDALVVNYVIIKAVSS